jgi:hypothetical protein
VLEILQADTAAVLLTDESSDVVGHGLRAAVVMGGLRSALRSYALLGITPDEVLGYRPQGAALRDRTDGAHARSRSPPP